MREAQSAVVEGRGADLAGAMRVLRGRTAEYAKQANATLTGVGRSPDIAELTERLAAVAADPVATKRLRDAQLRWSNDDSDEIAGLPVAVDLAPAKVQTPRPRSKTAAPAPQTAAETDSAERAASRRRLMREIADVDRAMRTAAHGLARAHRSIDDSGAKRAAAQAALERAQDDLQSADQRLAAAVERHRTLEHEIAGAERRAAALRAELDQLAADADR